MLAHIRETVVLAAKDMRRASRVRPVPGRGLRSGAVAVALVVGVALGAIVTPMATAWTSRTAVEGHG